MYERMLLESGKVFEGRRVSQDVIEPFARVVDDSKTIVIPVLIPEGKAVITSVIPPDHFIPREAFVIEVTIRNDGYDDAMFVSATNIDTGKVEALNSIELLGKGKTWTQNLGIVLDQEYDFNCLIEAGHVE